MENNYINEVLIILVFVSAFFLIFAIIFSSYGIALRIRNSNRRKRRSRLEKEWENKILDFSLGDLEAEDIWKMVDKKDRLFFIDYILRFSNRIAVEEKNRILTLATPYLDLLKDQLQNHKPELRAYALQSLAVLEFKENATHVIDGLDDPSPIVRLVAIHALVDKEHPEYIEPVLKRLDKFSSWRPNYLASLIASVGLDIAPPLRQAFADEQRPSQVRVIAGEALIKLNDLQSAFYADEVLKKSKDRDLIATSLRIIRQIGSDKQIETVRQFCDSEDDMIRGQAIGALGQLGGKEDLEIFSENLAHESSWVSFHAAKALSSSGGLDILKKFAESDSKRSEIAREVLLGSVT